MKELEFKQIEKAYFEERYRDVLDLWEKSDNIKEIMSFTNMYSYKICDSIATSYYKTKNFDKALDIINRRINLMLSPAGINDYNYENHFNFYYYFLLKTEIYRETGKDISHYEALLKYYKLKGNKKELLEWIPIVEDKLYNKYIRPIYLIYCPILYILLIIVYRTLKLSSIRNFYIAILFLGLLFFLFHAFIPKKYKKIHN